MEVGVTSQTSEKTHRRVEVEVLPAERMSSLAHYCAAEVDTDKPSIADMHNNMAAVGKAGGVEHAGGWGWATLLLGRMMPDGPGLDLHDCHNVIYRPFVTVN